MPEPVEDIGPARPAFDAVVAAQQTADIAVEDGVSLSMGLGQDGAGRAAADSRQCREGIEVLRQLPAVSIDAESGAAMEVAGTGVIAEPGPECQHAVEVGVGQ